MRKKLALAAPEGASVWVENDVQPDTLHPHGRALLQLAGQEWFARASTNDIVLLLFYFNNVVLLFL